MANKITMDKKACVNCKIKKSLNEFYVDKKHSDGKVSQCKECRNEARRLQYNTNFEKHRELARQWAKANPEKRHEYSREWIKKNPEKCREMGKAWRIKNKKYIQEYRMINTEKREKQSRQWAKNNPEKVKEIEKRRNIKRLSTPVGKLNHSMRKAIWRALHGAKAGRKWETLVGYTAEQLKIHLGKNFQTGMNWENYGTWEIDHRIPISVFNYEKPENLDFKRCWSLENLRPMWAKENMTKRNKLNQPFQPSLKM